MYQKVGFIGFGNMAQAIARSLIEKSVLRPNQVFATNRSEGKLKKAKDTLGINTLPTNEELVEAVDIVIVAVKPQDILSMLEPLRNSFLPEQIVISLAAGVPLDKLQRGISGTDRIARIMPNTPIEISQAVIGYCLSEESEALESVVLDLLEPLGYAVAVPEGEHFEALTVSCGSGTGFVFEIMQYWQEWIEEHGFEPEEARKMTVKTFLGAALLADHAEDINISELQNRVVSKKGVTHAGLESMRGHEVDRALRYAFEKAVLRDRELGK